MPTIKLHISTWLVVLIVAVCSQACQNKKAELVDQLKIATDSLNDAQIRLNAINTWRDQKVSRIQNHVAIPKSDISFDSLNYFGNIYLKRVSKWQPVVDSLNWELKKF